MNNPIDARHAEIVGEKKALTSVRNSLEKNPPTTEKQGVGVSSSVPAPEQPVEKHAGDVVSKSMTFNNVTDGKGVWAAHDNPAVNTSQCDDACRYDVTL